MKFGIENCAMLLIRKRKQERGDKSDEDIEWENVNSLSHEVRLKGR